MTIIRPKKKTRALMSRTLVAAICGIVVSATVNVVIYNRIVDAGRAADTQKKTVETARAENTELKKRWYEALGESNIRTFAKEYEFIKVAAPGYLRS